MLNLVNLIAMRISRPNLPPYPIGYEVGLLLILSQGLPEPNIINKRTTLRFLFTTNRCLRVGAAEKQLKDV